jgi:hypothetical protein
VPKKELKILRQHAQEQHWQAHAPFIKIHIQMRWKNSNQQSNYSPSAIVGQRRNTQGNGQNDFG